MPVPQPAPGPPTGGYNPNQNYGMATPAIAAGQGQTAQDAALTDTGTIAANTSGTTTSSSKYYNQMVPGTQPILDRVAGVGNAGNLYGAGKTLGQLQAELYDMGVNSPDQVAQLQTQLIQAGLLSPTAKNFSFGSVSADDPTDKAYQRLLEEAVKTGGDYNQILMTLANNPDNTRGQRNYKLLQDMQSAQAQAAQGIAPHTVHSTGYVLTDPNQARDLVKTSLANHLGRTANPDEINQFISTLRAQETTNPDRQSDTYGGTKAGGNPYVPTDHVTVSQRPDPAALADAFAYSTQDRANEAGTQSELGFLKVLQNLVGNTRSPV